MLSQLTYKTNNCKQYFFTSTCTCANTHETKRGVLIPKNSTDTSDRRRIRCLTPYIYGYIQPLPFSQIIIRVFGVSVS